MYSRDQTDYDFFKPLNSREKGRLDSIWRRIVWLKDKAEQREREGKPNASNLYRREYSALLWAYDYIISHNKMIDIQEDNDNT